MESPTLLDRVRRTSPTLALCIVGATAAVASLALPGIAPIAQSSSPYASPAQTATAGVVTIEIADFGFSNVVVRPGDTVQVVNADGVAHTLTADDASFDTGVIDANSSGAFVAPSTEGVVAFFCALHPSMRGELIVQS